MTPSSLSSRVLADESMQLLSGGVVPSLVLADIDCLEFIRILMQLSVCDMHSFPDYITKVTTEKNR